MAVTVSASNWTRNEPTASPYTIVLPSDVPSGATIILGVADRTDITTTLDSISDPVNGTWAGATIRQGPSDPPVGTVNRTWFVARTNSAALTGAGNRTITLTFSATITAQIVGGWIESSLGAMTFDAMATLTQINPTSTTWTSNTVSVGGSAGAIIGFAMCSSNQDVAAITVGSGEIELNTGSSARAWAFGEVFSSSGSYGFEVVTGSNSTGNFHVGSFLEPGGGSAPMFRGS